MSTVLSIEQVPFVDLGAQHATVDADVREAIDGLFERTDFILGESVVAFEQEFAAYSETQFAVGVDSGTSALELALRAYSVGPGDEVITAANTFIATALAISYTGATPVLVDVDPETYTMDVSALERAITPATKAVLPVHLYGQPADMDPIMEIARAHGLIVIEDACQAHGARYKGRRTGTLGYAAAFSFYPAKNLGAYGDGGMVTTNDARIADSLRMLRNYGQSKKYHHELRGFNRRLDTLQAAILRIKLKELNRWNDLRRRHAQQYRELLAPLHEFVVLPCEADYAESVYHLYVVRVDHRTELMEALKSKGIETGIHYPIPVHLQPAYEDLGYKRGDFPITEQYADEILSLPMYPEMRPDAVRRVCAVLAESVLAVAELSAERRTSTMAM